MRDSSVGFLCVNVRLTEMEKTYVSRCFAKSPVGCRELAGPVPVRSFPSTERLIALVFCCFCRAAEQKATEQPDREKDSNATPSRASGITY